MLSSHFQRPTGGGRYVRMEKQSFFNDKRNDRHEMSGIIYGKRQSNDWECKEGVICVRRVVEESENAYSTFWPPGGWLG